MSRPDHPTQRDLDALGGPSTALIPPVRRRMQAKDVPIFDVLTSIAVHHGQASIFTLHADDFPAVPFKVFKAKMDKLGRQGLVDCCCNQCSGWISLTSLGRDLITATEYANDLLTSTPYGADAKVTIDVHWETVMRPLGKLTMAELDIMIRNIYGDPLHTVTAKHATS